MSFLGRIIQDISPRSPVRVARPRVNDTADPLPHEVEPVQRIPTGPPPASPKQPVPVEREIPEVTAQDPPTETAAMAGSFARTRASGPRTLIRPTSATEAGDDEGVSTTAPAPVAVARSVEPETPNTVMPTTARDAPPALVDAETTAGRSVKPPLDLGLELANTRTESPSISAAAAPRLDRIAGPGAIPPARPAGAGLAAGLGSDAARGSPAKAPAPREPASGTSHLAPVAEERGEPISAIDIPREQEAREAMNASAAPPSPPTPQSAMAKAIHRSDRTPPGSPTSRKAIDRAPPPSPPTENSVRIGQINVVVAAPPSNVHGEGDGGTRGLESKRYLRSL